MLNLQIDNIHSPLSVSMFPTMFCGCCDQYYSPLKSLALNTWTITFPIAPSFCCIPQSSKQVSILFVWIRSIAIWHFVTKNIEWRLYTTLKNQGPHITISANGGLSKNKIISVNRLSIKWCLQIVCREIK